ncbi:MAG TPA: phytanoyl-CoA dioxygenase family protein [Allosphingosinicella sp.]|nr:phytanoyl-CoA dioxygenase family protein [Allosphingosinicella sp.]
MQQIFTDPAHQNAFEDNGFTVIRLMSGEEATSLHGQIDASGLGKGFARNSENPYHATYFDDDKAYRREAYAFARGAIAERAAPLLCGYRMITGGFVVKHPGDGPVPLHRDWTLTDDAGRVTLNFWLPLVDADENNGAMRLVPGSARLVPNIETAHVDSYFTPFGEAVKGISTVIPVKAGEALVFDSAVLHWSDENRSARARPAILATWIPEDCRTVFYSLDRQAEGRRFALVDMDGDGLIDHTSEQLAAGDYERPTIGFVENRNRPVSQREFERLLACRRRQEEGGRGSGRGLLREVYRRLTAAA